MSGFDKFVHVTPQRRKLVESEFEVRKAAIYENIWISYPQAERVLAHVQFIVSLPRTGEGHCLVVHSEPGMGKSALYKKIMQDFGMASGAKDCLAEMTIDIKRLRSHKTFSNDLISSLTLGGITSSLASDKAILEAIGVRNVRGVGIDEFNNLLATSAREQQLNMIQLKSISGPPFSLVVIILGTSNCREAIAHDAQFSRRYVDLELPPWRDQELVRSFVQAYVSTFPLRLPSSLDKPSITKYLIKESDGVLGRIVNQLKNAATWSILDGKENIDFAILKKGLDLPLKLET